MKRKLTSLLIAAIAAFSFCSNSFAKDNVTDSYLTSANLQSLDGWTLDKEGFGGPGYTAWNTSGGVPVIEFYHSWSANAGAAIGTTKEFRFSQKVTLPEGYYRLAVNAFYREGNGTGTNTKAYIYAGEQKQNVIGLSSSGVASYSGSNDLLKAADAFSKGDFSNEFDFQITSEQEVEIGFYGYIDTYCSWCILGPVTLWKYAAEDYMSDYTTKVTQAEALYDTPMNKDVLAELKTAAGKESLLVTVDDVKQAVSDLNAAILAANNSIAEYEKINKCIQTANKLSAKGVTSFAASGIAAAYEARTLINDETAQAALKTAVLAQTEVGTDITLAFGDITSSTNNWSIENEHDFHVNTWSGEGNTDGSGMVTPFMEYWETGGSILPENTITYTFKGLVPNQYFEVSALVRAYKEAEAVLPTGAQFFVGASKSEDISTGTDGTAGKKGMVYGTFSGVAKSSADGELKVGLIIGENNFNWIAIKNITIKIAADPGLATLKTQYNTLYNKADEIKNLPMNATVSGALASAMITPEETSDAYSTAITSLDAAYKDAQTSIKKYAAAYEYINRSNNLDATGSAIYVADETYIALNAAYTNGTLDEITADQKTALDAVYMTAVKSQTSEGANYTYVIVNPSFETGNTNGWDVGSSNDTGARSTTNATYVMSGSDGNYLFNTWQTGLPITQTITGIPNGTYILKAVIASDAENTVFITANTERVGGSSEDKSVGKEVSLEFYVSDNTAKIGAIGGRGDVYVEDGGYWYKVDNFRLSYVSSNVPAPSLGIATFTGSDSDDAKLVITFDNYSNQLAATSADNKYVINIKINDEDYSNTCSADKGAVIAYNFSSVETYTIQIPDGGIKLVNSMDEVIAETKGTIKETFSLYSDSFTNSDFSFGTPVTGTIRTYAKDIASSKETSGMQAVPGWSYTVGGDAHAAGTFEYGTNVGLGDPEHKVPAEGPDGTNGYGLGVLGVWSASSYYTQTIRLDAGKYMVQIPTYNAGGTDKVSNLTGVIINGKSTYSKTSEFKVGVWTTQTIEFTLTATTAVTVSLGYTSLNKGSGSCPHFFYDRVDIFLNDDIEKAKLTSAKNDALAAVNALTPIGDGIFKYSQDEINTAIAAINASKTIEAVGEVAIPEMKLPEAEKAYQISLQSSGKYMSINGSDGVKLSNYAQPLYIKAVKGGYGISEGTQSLAYKGGNTWSLVGATNASTLIITPVAEAYTIKSSNGYIGVDSDAAGSDVYGNKDAHNWIITEYAPTEINISDALIIESYDHIIADNITIDAAVNGTTAMINNGTVSTNSLTLNVEIPNNEWSFMIMPCDVPVADFKNTQDNTQWKIYSYDGAARANGDFNNVWVAATESTTLAKGTGSIIQSRRGEETTSVFSFTTTDATSIANIFAKEDIKISLAENKSDYACNSGWNLVGNPYLSFFNKSQMSSTAPITVWESNNYVTYTSDDKYALSPLQAFFIQTAEATDITFSKDGRQLTASVSSGANARRVAATERNLYNITLSDGSFMDKTRFVINEDASLEYEIGSDASKFMSEDTSVPQIFTVENNVKYSVNERPLSQGIINLGVRVASAGTYTISVGSVASAVVLEDKLTGEMVVLNDESDSYTFTVTEPGTIEGRFVIRASEATGIAEMAQEENNDAIYTLQGVKVSKSAAKHGIYLVNGKKVMIK